MNRPCQFAHGVDKVREAAVQAVFKDFIDARVAQARFELGSQALRRAAITARQVRENVAQLLDAGMQGARHVTAQQQ